MARFFVQGESRQGSKEGQHVPNAGWSERKRCVSLSDLSNRNLLTCSKWVLRAPDSRCEKTRLEVDISTSRAQRMKVIDAARRANKGRYMACKIGGKITHG